MKTAMHVGVVNRVLLGLLFLIPGLMKLFYIGIAGVTSMISTIGFPIPAVFAWILILSEIIFGLAILVNWKLHYTVWPLIVIMLVGAFTVYWPVGSPMNWPIFIMHLVIASNLWVIGSCWCTECCCEEERPKKISKRKR